ncbi:MAG: S8 family serine peptidase [Terricaulis sp.]
MPQGPRPRWAIAAALSTLLTVGASCAPTASTTPDICPPIQAESGAPDLAALRAKAEADGSVRVIVRLTPPAGAQPIMATTQAEAVAAFERAGVQSVSALNNRLPYIVAEVTLPQLDELYRDPRFGAWSEDRILQATLSESGPLVQAPELWALGGRGAGQSVAILDTGVDAAHPFLAGRVVAEACFSTTSAANASTSACPNGQPQQIEAGAARPCSAPGCEHGTHVAGIAAGRGADFSGMAPDADIVAVQVFSQFSGAGCGGRPRCVASFTSDQIRALDFVLQLAAERHVAAVNMSLGGGRSTTACDTDMTKSVIDQLRAAGVATAIASGNDGFRDSVSFPGCISSAVTVGATSKDDQVADFSNCGPQVDLHAPGVSINSSVPGGGFASFSGTSMATPHVAGAFAALRSARPTATIDQIEAALRESGLNVGGRPRIRVVDALNKMGGAAKAAQGAMAEPTSDPANARALAQLAALPADQPARFIVSVRGPLDRAEAAARGTGAAYVGRMGSQPMLVVEATPDQVRALIASGVVASIQPDRVARPQ